eukprot:3442240-Pyramimonas_sp.AAC.1
MVCKYCSQAVFAAGSIFRTKSVETCLTPSSGSSSVLKLTSSVVGDNRHGSDSAVSTGSMAVAVKHRLPLEKCC